MLTGLLDESKNERNCSYTHRDVTLVDVKRTPQNISAGQFARVAA